MNLQQRSGRKLCTWRLSLGAIFGAISIFLFLGVIATGQSKKPAQAHGPMLASLRIQEIRPGAPSESKEWRIERFRSKDRNDQPTQPTVNTPTFGNPVISGIGGVGFEQSIRVDPNPISGQTAHRIYTSAPGSASADTSWVWNSLDGGKTFKWVVGAAPLEGKVTTCHGGGDSEIAIDTNSHLYFNDLTLANFSTARSDDFGTTFTCSNTGVPDSVVDRQWYAIDGDPTNGGNIYLVNDEIGQGGVICGTAPANNVLAMYRSPVDPLLGATAGIEFGPPNRITPINGCDEAIMGNNEISSMATPTGQPNGSGGFAVLPLPVRHIYVVHDNVNLNQIRMGRCFPVAFGAPVANVSDPSGLNCTDFLVRDLGANAKTGANFPTMAIDRSGNLYVVWEEAPLTGGVISGDVSLKFSYSTNEGNTWSQPITIDTSGSPVGVLHQNVFAWLNAGDDGRVALAWYGTPDQATSGSFGPDDCNTCSWSVWYSQSLNAHSANPTFTAPILTSSHPIHKGNVQSLIGGQNQLSSRALGDYLQMRIGAKGEAHIAYVDSNNIEGAAVGHAMYVQQNGGSGLVAGFSPLSTPGLAAFNGASDQGGDGKYEAGGISSATMPQLDILHSNMQLATNSPCSVAAPCYKVTMQINNLSLSPTLAQDPNPDLVWSTQWFVPSMTDGAGGKNFHVYAESFNGSALQCFVGENALLFVGGGGVLTYPGNTQLPAANCQSTLGPNGSITIYVPLSQVTEVTPIDNKLHEVTSSTMTLLNQANSVPSVSGIGGSLFNLIDVVQDYVFDPALVTAVSRKVHPGAGTFDVDLASSIECRSGGANGDYQVVITFGAAPTAVAGATVTPGAGGTASVSGSPAISGNTVVVNLTNVSNAQRLTINLSGVVMGLNTADVAVDMAVLVGDTNSDGSVNSADIGQTKSQSGQIVGAGNFREDVTVDGSLNSADVGLVKSRSGTALP